MTEAEWLICMNPALMLEFLRASGRVCTNLPGGSNRKLWLFKVACCRQVWPLLTDERSRRAVEVIERYADGEANWVDMCLARDEAREAWLAASDAVKDAAGVAYIATEDSAEEVAEDAAETADNAGDDPAATRKAQCGILRDLFGNPPRMEPVIDSAWLHWNDGTAARIAEVMYQSRDFSPMPLLADALEDAGCGNEYILCHCREPGEHVRGCWVIDALLGRG